MAKTPRRPVAKRPRLRPIPKKVSPPIFPVGSPRINKLKGDKRIADRMRETFEPIGLGDMIKALKIGKTRRLLTTDLYRNFRFDPKTGAVKVSPRGLPVDEAISSPLALYRTLCLFPDCRVNPDPLWTVYLRHVSTAQVVNLREEKGAFLIETVFSSLKDAPKAFSRDLLRLLNALVHPRCPHPNGHVAGSIG